MSNTFSNYDLSTSRNMPIDNNGDAFRLEFFKLYVIGMTLCTLLFLLGCFILEQMLA